jgi:hypothetical protein
MNTHLLDRPDAPIRFKFSAEKARNAIEWMLSERESLDLHSILKACYFADKAHLNKHGRPIFGAVYRAMRFGPVALEIYEMLKGEPYWLCEIKADEFPWRLERHTVKRVRNARPDTSALSKSDLDELTVAFHKSLSLNFDERTSATHGPDWQKAKLGLMRYEDMIDESPKKEELISYLRESGPFIRL